MDDAEDLTEEDRRGTGDLAPVGHAYGPMEAALAGSMLDAAGIPSYVQARLTAANAWHDMTALGGMAILVPDADADAARALLADFAPWRPRRRPLLWAVLGVLAFVLAGIPPPGSGFFLGRRAEASEGLAA
jgi:hypothetical protein